MYRYRRRHLTEDHENLDRWLVSYADYMTLMFAFFVVLYAMAMINNEKFEQLSDKLGEVFSQQKDPGTGVPGEGLLDESKHADTPLYGESLVDAKGSKLVDADTELTTLDKQRTGTPLSELENQLNEALLPVVESGLADVEIDGDWLILELRSGLLFASGSAGLGPNAQPVLSSISDTLSQSANYIRVRGFTDDQPIRNEQFSSNWELSVARATSVLRLLEQQLDPERLAIEAYGPYQPKVSNDTARGRAENRRVVIAVSKYAWTPEIQIANEILIADDDMDTQGADTPAADTQSDEKRSKIRFIRLPNGALRITTRDD
ncbi:MULTISPECIES: flagellar motor protein MotB [Corallincola]|uniref:Flagellar motor protein n=3 Tax=Corallincola TaxID=1775176 RepID=A0A368N5L3_9GAMM|nr:MULTISPECIES: flagellar motor protein MotB [Corallincola]RCU44549.1 flagellar motor protein [Corallincola holothuriorum]TAA40294.1 flagellar motor protein [Corallincola spongiicola]TCI05399.1 flagellar motor protein [Corallincola luteus]